MSRKSEEMSPCAQSGIVVLAKIFLERIPQCPLEEQICAWQGLAELLEGQAAVEAQEAAKALRQADAAQMRFTDLFRSE